MTILLGCVDGAAGRQEIAHCLARARNSSRADEQPASTWWIDSGNSLHSGQVLCGNVATVDELRAGLMDSVCLRLPSPTLLHPELLIPQPEEEAEPSARRSCKDLVLIGEPAMQQSRTINAHMAALVYGYVERLVYGGLTIFASYTDTAVGVTRSLEITPEALALGRPPSFFTTNASLVAEEEHDEPSEEEDEEAPEDEEYEEDEQDEG